VRGGLYVYDPRFSEGAKNLDATLATQAPSRCQRAMTGRYRRRNGVKDLLRSAISWQTLQTRREHAHAQIRSVTSEWIHERTDR
jgi:hypothetical protein